MSKRHRQAINITKKPEERQGWLKRGSGGRAEISYTHHSKRQWGPQSFFNKCKKTLGGKEMDTLDPGKENTLNILHVAKEAWIRPPVLMSSTHSHLFRSTTEFTATKNIHTYGFGDHTFVVSKANSAGQMHRTFAEALMYKRMGI